MQKTILLLPILIFSSFAFSQKCHGRRHIISPDDNGRLVLQYPEVLQYHPGDTLVLNSSKTWVYLGIDNYKGSPSCPLVIINDSGQVKFKGKHGIEITNSTYIKLTGTGSRYKYGIFMEGDPMHRLADGKGAEIHMRSKNIELSNISVHNMGFGFVCRTDNYCEDSLTYPNWVIDSIFIHDCRIVGIWYEGMYLGNTSPDNAKDSYDPRPIVCHGDTVYPMPMRNGTTRVYNNYVDSTGRGGIQLASASTGRSEIYNNTVKHCGLNGDTDQGTGISVGTYSRVSVHDNTVSNTFTFGIASIGGSATNIPLRIENNKVDSSGYLSHYDLIVTDRKQIDPFSEPVYKDTLAWPYSIEVVTRPTKFKDSTMFWVINNKVGRYKNKQGAIQVSDDYISVQHNGNIICHNTDLRSGSPASFFVNPEKGSFHYSTDCSHVKSGE